MNDNLNIESSYDYFCLTEPERWHTINAVRLLRAIRRDGTSSPVMSLRLSTGIIGELDCPAGNDGPKDANEVIIGLGKKGIEGLLELGALPCVACRPAEKLANMDTAIHEQLARNTDGLIENATDPEWLTNHYDSRRLNWSQLTALGISPGRFYTRPDLESDAISSVTSLFLEAQLRVPDIGHYDDASPVKFSSYRS